MQLDERTGKPFPISPTSPRELGLKYYSVNLFSQYHVAHAYLDGVNVRSCYSGADPENVRFKMVEYKNRPAEPGYFLNRKDIVARSGEGLDFPAKHQFIGSRKTNSRYGDWVQFDSFCGDWTAGGVVSLGIRDKRSWSIEQFIETRKIWTQRFNADEIARGTVFRAQRQPAENVVRNGNAWVYLHERSPTVPGADESETWILPIGDSNYYFCLSFGYMSGAKAANDAEYLRIRGLVEQIVDSFKVEKL
ncbi:DUF769 domain-containing protein [Roseateles sp. YR242]|uniref:DUF769 domain-containing protein n=1 Tax=Roseateles sp. YR242 TaxID=1855305 RepID=UPI0038574B5E